MQFENDINNSSYIYTSVDQESDSDWLSCDSDPPSYSYGRSLVYTASNVGIGRLTDFRFISSRMSSIVMF